MNQTTQHISQYDIYGRHIKAALMPVFLGVMALLLGSVSTARAAVQDYLIGDVTLTYAQYDPNTQTHARAANWQLTNFLKWEGFSKALGNLPAAQDNAAYSKFADNDFIKIEVTDQEGIRRQLIYVAEGTVRVTSYIKEAGFYRATPEALQFLQSEKEKYADIFAFEENSKEITVPDNALKVTYNSYNLLPRPVWIVEEGATIRKYAGLFENLPILEDDDVTRYDSRFEEPVFFEMQFRPETIEGPNPDRIEVKQGLVRITDWREETSYHNDSMNYFTWFRQQAQKHMKEGGSGQ